MKEASQNKRLKIGDIVEISTPRGLAYAQYTHKKDLYGYLIRVLPGLYKERPVLSELVEKKEKFFTFFALGSAVSNNIVTIVGNEPVPSSAKDFPLMRKRGFIDKNGTVLNWWIWDGEKSIRTQNLSPDQKHLPIASILNDTVLIDRILEDWSPEGS